jgi:hypothetical protein
VTRQQNDSKRAGDGARRGRRRFIKQASATAFFGLTGCGGSDPTVAQAAAPGAPAAPAPAPAPAGPTTRPPAAPPPPSTFARVALSTLYVQSPQAGLLPYHAAVFPLEGAVPAGTTLESPEDPTLGATVLSRWPDGSAAVVVVAGETTLAAGTIKKISLRPVSRSVAPLAPARVAQLVSALSVDCGGVGTASVADLGKPERVWWANERVICCRYRAPVGSHPTLEAVFDVHAFAGGRALVELVLENGKVSIASPARPTAVQYASATLRVNGAAAGTIAAPNVVVGGYTLNSHEAFRAAYLAAWVGGDPQVEVTHDASSLQSHPLFFRCDQPGGSMAAYASDAYSPWSTGRQRASGMGAGGDHPSIGPLPRWEAQYVQTGDANARRAVIANALAILTYNVNFRDAATGLPPTFDALAGRSFQSGFPNNGNANDAFEWEVAHHPAAGLVAFLCRPSPAFIEIAQKVAVWNGLWDYSGKAVFSYWFQTRGKAWCVRSLSHAVFVTPDGAPWKTAGRAALGRNLQLVKRFKDSPEARLGFVWDSAPSAADSTGQGSAFFDMAPGAGFNNSLWQHHYLAAELHKLASSKVAAASDQALADEVADWATLQPVRWVNESTAGEWRYIAYKNVVGKRDGSSNLGMDSEPTWGAQRAWYHTEAAPPVAGPWNTFFGNVEPTTYATGWSIDGKAGALYPSYFWAALVAAVERRVPGADTAWSTVISNVSNLAAWRSGFADEPRWGSFPRTR